MLNLQQWLYHNTFVFFSLSLLSSLSCFLNWFSACDSRHKGRCEVCGQWGASLRDAEIQRGPWSVAHLTWHAHKHAWWVRLHIIWNKFTTSKSFISKMFIVCFADGILVDRFSIILNWLKEKKRFLQSGFHPEVGFETLNSWLTSRSFFFYLE